MAERVAGRFFEVRLGLATPIPEDRDRVSWGGSIVWFVTVPGGIAGTPFDGYIMGTQALSWN